MMQLTQQFVVWYLEAALLLAVVWLLLTATQRLTSPTQVGPLELTRLVRTLVIAALLSPLVIGMAASAILTGVLDFSTVAPPSKLDKAPEDSGSLVVLQTVRSLWERPEAWPMRWVQPTLATLLLGGVLVAASRTALKLHQLRRLLAESVSLRRIGRVRIVVSDAARVPFSTLVGGSAHVVLPVAVLAEPSTLRLAVRHELQHHRQRDAAWAIAVELLRVVFFWNPAVHGTTRRLLDLQELACDEALLRRGVPAEVYGDCLMQVAQLAVQQRPLVASTAMATSSPQGRQLRRRLNRLFEVSLDRLPVASRRMRLWQGACVVVVLTAAVASVIAFPRDYGAPALAPPLESDSKQVEPTMAPVLAALGERGQAPELVFTTPEGQDVSLASLRGQVVLVSFWDASCRFCEGDAALLRGIEANFGGAGLQLVGVSLSKSERDSADFVDRHQLGWPQRHEPERWHAESSQVFGVRGVPSHYLVDRKGRFVNVPLGNLHLLESAIAAMLDEG